MTWIRRLAVLGCTAALLAAGVTPAAGQFPDSTESTFRSASAQTKTITLITGDVVELYTGPDGRQSARMRGATPLGGSAGHVAVTTAKGEVYVYPHAALPLVTAGKLDKELFNVTKLARYEYDDAHTTSLPLIVTYGSPSGVRAKGAGAQATKAADLAGSRRKHVFKGIDGVALHEEKKQAALFWSGLTGAPVKGSPGLEASGASAPDSLRGGVAKVWLDEKVRAGLEQSVPQIGAPQAWAAGLDGTGTKVAVLDTGVDAAHPDLAGRITEARSFVSGVADADDGHGHGTHVAGTVAGSGAASVGRRKGVAPGARLYVGKVLDDGGSGLTSDIIAGMEWAAGSGASVVNMSLGSVPTDGTDPLSSAVNSLTESHGTLFVVAAGNAGARGAESVVAPGVADAALTVGAVDKQDDLTRFSSRGPRIGDFGVKPDLTAPGAGIVAALAQGTNMTGGPVVDDHYLSANGTSMAAPHVAGAAAILKQRHPDWSAHQLKSALVGSAKAVGQHPFDGGSGRVDVARAVKQRVVADGAVSFGSVPPASDAPSSRTTERTVTYRNSGDTAIILDLALEEAPSAPAGMFSAGAASVTVPAGGTATVTVTAAPGDRAAGLYGTHLVAAERGGDEVVRTSVALRIGAPDHDLSVGFKDRLGNVPCQVSAFVFDQDGNFAPLNVAPDGTSSMTLPQDDYGVMSVIRTCTPGTSDDRVEVTQADIPELSLTSDTSIVMDARKAQPVTLKTPRPTDAHHVVLNSDRLTGRGARVLQQTEVQYWEARVSALPTQAVETGAYAFNETWFGHEPWLRDVHLKTPGSRTRMTPMYVVGSPHLDGRKSARLVHGGTGSDADLRKHDVRGAIVVVDSTDARSVAEAARGRGALAVILIHDGGRVVGQVTDLPLPVLGVALHEGHALLRALKAGGDSPILAFRGLAEETYSYVGSVEAARIPDAPLTQVMDARNSTVIDRVYHGESSHVWTTPIVLPHLEGIGLGMSVLASYPVPTNKRIEEWYLAGKDRYGWLVAPGPGKVMTETQYRTLRAGERLRESFGKAVVKPSVPLRTTPFSFWRQYAPPPPGTADFGAQRSGNSLELNVSSADDGAGPGSENFGYPETLRRTLYRGDKEVAATGESSFTSSYTTTPESARYRYVYETERGGQFSGLSTQTRTEWSFVSGRQEETRPLALVQVGYDIPVDRQNRAPAGSRFSFDLSAYQIDSSLPKVTSLKAWGSIDDGKTWTSLHLRKSADGRWTAQTKNPRTGFVSLRVQAADAAGNSVDQTIIRAYRVS
ncbi:S8 family serine peptidase [Streptomyces sp. NPDC056222]|uniref:S8 family peptidase n=1 Tax=Streptomyces sp. NPDC056222 TaxID=3345749 RepID=UPI0035D641B5